MKINKLRLVNFRNYDDIQVTFTSGVQYIQGGNGTGKTSLVEGIGLLPFCKSIRTSDEKEIIKIGTESAIVEAEVEGKYVESLKMVISQKGKYFESNGTGVKRISDIAGIVKVVSFLPKDVELFKEVPIKRRKFLDMNLSLLDNVYLRLLTEYNHYLLEIRNLIKNSNVDFIYLKILVHELIKRGFVIQQKRQEFISSLNREINPIMKEIENDSIKVEIVYHPDLVNEDINEYESEVYKRIESSLKNKDINRISIRGIHSDDISVNFNEKDLGTFGSQGQNRITVIALKLAVFSVIKNQTGDEAIVILDDVLSELDVDHQRKLMMVLNKIEQVFITGTSDLKDSNYCLFKVKENMVRRNM